MNNISKIEQFLQKEKECKILNGHCWIIKDKKYICEYCKKESVAFKELKDFENTLPKIVFSS